ADGSVYFGTGELDEGGQRVGRLYALNPQGQLVWSFSTDDWIESSPAIGPDGTVYFGANDHYVYAVGSPRKE
ncbi:MAG: PQQ-binding-like beta-propeller repeat protein, partial [Candidatus Brocadiales bacterium]